MARMLATEQSDQFLLKAKLLLAKIDMEADEDAQFVKELNKELESPEAAMWGQEAVE